MDQRGEFSQVPFTRFGQTRFTPLIDSQPFGSHGTRAVVALRHVSPEWGRRFKFQVKAARLFGDEDRQVGIAVPSQEFTIQGEKAGDQGYYLAWRGEESREQLLMENEDATVVIRLLR